MPRPTFGTRTIQSPKRFISNSILSSNLSTAAVGLSAGALGIRRHAHTVSFGQVTTGGIKNKLAFVAPPSGATILSAKVNAGTLMYHTAGEADTWIFQLKNKSTAGANASLIKNNASLSGVTLGLTSFKSLPMNGGNSTLQAGAGLYAQLSVSGTAQTLINCSIHIEWVPLNNA